MCDRRHQPASSSQYFIVCAFGYESAAHSLLPEVRGGKASVKYFTFELAIDLISKTQFYFLIFGATLGYLVLLYDIW